MKKRKVLATILGSCMVLSLAACGGSTDTEDGASSDETTAVSSGVEDGVLTIAMECAYAPYNWTQPDSSNGAVSIKDSADYANGYDVMIAQRICEANGWELEVVATAWDSLIPALQAGTLDAIIAGQSMTEERMEQVDMAGPYYYATFVCVTKPTAPWPPPRASATSPAPPPPSPAPTGMSSACPRLRGGDPVRRRDRPGHDPCGGERHRGLHLHRHAHRHGRGGHL